MNQTVDKNKVITEREICVVSPIEGHVLFHKLQGIHNEEYMTIQEVIDEAKKSEYFNLTFIIICESELSGTIYRYNNYGKDEVVVCGEMGGYA